jgi:hypothetical protein
LSTIILRPTFFFLVGGNEHQVVSLLHVYAYTACRASRVRDGWTPTRAEKGEHPTPKRAGRVGVASEWGSRPSEGGATWARERRAAREGVGGKARARGTRLAFGSERHRGRSDMRVEICLFCNKRVEEGGGGGVEPGATLVEWFPQVAPAGLPLCAGQQQQTWPLRPLQSHQCPPGCQRPGGQRQSWSPHHVAGPYPAL